MNRPGLIKARELPLVLSRTMHLIRGPDPRWRALFERADTVSEGGVRHETQGRMWYGTTSLILRTTGEGDPVHLAALAEHDVHVRVRALRTARREACSRAPSPLGRLVCEMHFFPASEGVRIDVDVQAPLIERTPASNAAR